jgi:hypothetical protein
MTFGHLSEVTSDFSLYSFFDKSSLESNLYISFISISFQFENEGNIKIKGNGFFDETY